MKKNYLYVEKNWKFIDFDRGIEWIPAENDDSVYRLDCRLQLINHNADTVSSAMYRHNSKSGKEFPIKKKVHTQETN
jgi:hypothetical protein